MLIVECGFGADNLHLRPTAGASSPQIGTGMRRVPGGICDEVRRINSTIAKHRGTPETTSGLLWPGAGPAAAKGYPLS